MTSKCKGCNKPVVEKVLRFDGDAWHPECFTCAGCKDPLDGKEITQVDGKAMCKDCYINKFTDKCYKCNKPISPGQPFMEIEGGKMHADCFKCADCGKSLAGEACVKIVDNYICSNCSRRRWSETTLWKTYEEDLKGDRRRVFQLTVDEFQRLREKTPNFDKLKSRSQSAAHPRDVFIIFQ